MKTLIFPGWGLQIVLAGVVVLSCSAQNDPGPSPTTPTSDQSTAGTSAPAGPALVGLPEGTSPPSKAQLSPCSLEVQKLAQAQVDQEVILTYITNSAGIFNLTADDIIHLKNRGASPAVINAMIQHDQELLSGARAVIVVTTPSATPAASSPAPGPTQIIANDESWVGEPFIPDEGYYAPEQPENTGPVRAPYPVKLNDPIIVLKLPSFTVPYW